MDGMGLVPAVQAAPAAPEPTGWQRMQARQPLVHAAEIIQTDAPVEIERAAYSNAELRAAAEVIYTGAERPIHTPLALLVGWRGLVGCVS